MEYYRQQGYYYPYGQPGQQQQPGQPQPGQQQQQQGPPQQQPGPPQGHQPGPPQGQPQQRWCHRYVPITSLFIYGFSEIRANRMLGCNSVGKSAVRVAMEVAQYFSRKAQNRVYRSLT